MDMQRDHTLGETLAAALDWWREAGVDGDFADEPRNWLEKPAAPSAEAPAAQAEQTAKRPAAPALPPLGGDRSSWPASLDAFPDWWRGIESPGSGPAIAPRGQAQAELMVLVPMPEEDDGETLLSGRQGELVANMLKAMGVERSYLAAALPHHVRHPDWNALAQRQLGDVLRHHIALAQPKRVLILGRKMLPLFGHDPAQATPIAGQMTLEGVDVPVLAAVGPETLLDEPRFRKTLWRAWLDWSGLDWTGNDA
jgi:uracil-DNA glycosylase family 4